MDSMLWLSPPTEVNKQACEMLTKLLPRPDLSLMPTTHLAIVPILEHPEHIAEYILAANKLVAPNYIVTYASLRKESFCYASSSYHVLTLVFTNTQHTGFGCKDSYTLHKITTAGIDAWHHLTDM